MYLGDRALVQDTGHYVPEVLKHTDVPFPDLDHDAASSVCRYKVSW